MTQTAASEQFSAPRLPPTMSPKPEIDKILQSFTTISLEALNQLAQLQTRKDRKYILTPEELQAVLGGLEQADTSILDTQGQHWFSYESVYFDTPTFDSYRLAATKRPARFKVRTRCYLDSRTCVLEVKTKNRRGRTVKHRQKHAMGHSTELDRQAETYLKTFGEVSPFVEDLDATLLTNYQRATLVFAETGSRATIDAQFSCSDAAGRKTGLGDKLIVETKSSGRPTPLDYALWSAGFRPIKISKFATGLAALNPELAANRWTRVLRGHFGFLSNQHDRTRRLRASAQTVDQPLPQQG